MKRADVAWKEGRAFSLAYFPGHEVMAVADAAYSRFSSDNALNVGAFPSLREIQHDVVDIVRGWTGGDVDAAGFMTTGGTESLLLAVKAARQRGRRERGIDDPNIVLPTSAHAAFEKACHYFGLESRRVAVGADWRADPAAIDAAIDDRTVLVVASAPQYPQGVIDPISEIAALAAVRDINFHVDACMGGVVLPYLSRLDVEVPPWNFAVDGVTSISVDLHKYAYTTKGASVLIHRNRTLRDDQTFVTDNWLGGPYGSSGVLGSKGGGAMAAAWAVMHHLGDDGYLRLTAAARRAAVAFATAIDARPALRLLAPPDTTLVTFAASDPERLDVYAIADRLWNEGWYVDRQSPPPSLHCTVSAVHDGLDQRQRRGKVALAMDQAFGHHGLARATQADHESHVVDDSEHQHTDAQRHQGGAKVARRVCARQHVGSFQRVEELVDREAESDQRQRRAEHRHQGAVGAHAGALKRHAGAARRHLGRGVAVEPAGGWRRGFRAHGGVRHCLAARWVQAPRLMQRIPRWQVDVSTGCGMRAAGR